MTNEPSEVIRLLQELVRTPSPNPPGAERDVQAVIQSFLATLPGVRVSSVEDDPQRPILIARLDGSRPGRTVIFGGHVDTVPPGEGWTRDPYGGSVDGGLLYGRGASDMKGGVAAILVALKRLAQEPRGLRGSVVVHCVPDEEPGGVLGAKLLLDRGLIEGDAAIIAEPSELTVYAAQKGNLFATVGVRGRAAHGSMPHHGINAISAAARLICDLEDTLSPRISERHHPLVGAATLSIGKISGGRATNVVPDECSFSVDRRLVPGESHEDALEELRAFIGERGELSVENAGAAFETSPDHWLTKAAVEALFAVTSERPPLGGLVGSSDARFYADGAGIPTLIVGPGSMSQAHVADEHVRVDLVERAVDVYEQLARDLLR